MLYQYGPVQFQLWPFNIHETDRDASYDFAEHQVIGALQPLEKGGLGRDEIVLSGRLFPRKLGGLSNLDALRALAETQEAQPLMRGDGRPLGWRVITRLGERGSWLDAKGVGQVIEFEASFRLAPRPGAQGWYSALVSLFG